MKLTDYIKGDRRGRKARDLELRSMSDDFLSDALEGLTESPGDHVKNISELEDEIIKELCPRRNHLTVVISAIAGFLIAGGAFYYFFLNDRIGPTGQVNDPLTPVPAMAAKDDTGISGQSSLTDHGSVDSVSTVGPPPAVAAAGRDYGTVPDEIQAGSGNGEATIQNRVKMVFYSYYGEDASATVSAASAVSRPRIGVRRFEEYLNKTYTVADGGTTGEVVVTFRVNRYGRPSGIRVVGMLTPEAHREVLRLLENGPEWVETEQKVTVGFRLN